MKVSNLLVSLAALAVISSPVKAQDVQLDFEGAAKTAIPFKGFEISNEDGSPIAAGQKAVLKFSRDVVDSTIIGTNSTLEEMKSKGYLDQDNLMKEAKKVSDKALTPIVTTAGEYVNEFNKVEQKLNSLGHTIRETSEIVASEIQKVNREGINEQVKEAAEVYTKKAVEELEERKAQIDKTIAEFDEAYKNGIQPPASKEAVYLSATKDSCGTINPNASTLARGDLNCHVDSIKQDPTPFLSPQPETCASDTPLGKSVLVNEPWNDGGGDKKFGWNASALFKLTTDTNGLTAKATANVNGLLLGKEKAIIEAEADFITGRASAATSHRKLAVFGKKISGMDETFAIPLINSRDAEGNERFISKKDYPIFSQTFMVGFVPVLVAVDSTVSMGPRYDLQLVPVKVSGKVEWVTKVTVIASAGVGADLKLFLIMAGIKGYVDLVNNTIGAYPSAELFLEPESNRPKITARFSSLAALETLSGRIDLGVWAKTTFPVPQPKKSFPFVEFKPFTYSWTQTIGDYPGYKFPVATIFDKKVGYDICSGAKTVETLIANEPRPRDERESFASKEKVRVQALEGKLRAAIEERLHDAKAEEYERKIEGMNRDIEILSQDAMNAARTLAVDTAI